MCDSVIVSRNTGKPIEIKPGPHRLVYCDHTGEHLLLDGFEMHGRITFSSVSKTPDGYVFVVRTGAELPPESTPAKP